MKKRILGIISLIILILSVAGCSSTENKAVSLSVIYGIAAAISLLLLIGCLVLVREKKCWFILLFSSVFVVNCGYTALSVSACLEAALWANRLAYLGSVFLPLSMLMIILSAANVSYKRWLPLSLLALATVVFLIAASPGVLDLYYKEVSLVVVNGAASLEKVYGPLHPIYLVYLLGYFSAMAAVIIHASVKKKVGSTANAWIIAIAVFANIGVWLIEQIVKIDFEILSVSYIISELFLLGVHLVLREQQSLLTAAIAKKDAELMARQAVNEPLRIEDVTPAMMECFEQGLETLTPTEREVYRAYLEGHSTKEIMTMLDIKENTLKFHNKNLYNNTSYSIRRIHATKFK